MSDTTTSTDLQTDADEERLSSFHTSNLHAIAVFDNLNAVARSLTGGQFTFEELHHIKMQQMALLKATLETLNEAEKFMKASMPPAKLEDVADKPAGHAVPSDAVHVGKIVNGQLVRDADPEKKH